MDDSRVVELLIALRNAPESLFGATLDYIRRCTGKDGANWQKLHQSVVDAGLGAVVTKAPAPQAQSLIIQLDNPGVLFSPVDFDARFANWTSADDYDRLSVALPQVDMAKLVEVTMLKPNEIEIRITGDMRFKRMKKNKKIGLDLRLADVMQKDWLSRGLNGYLEQYFKLTGRKVLVCMGQPLLSPVGDRYVLCFCRVGGESPYWYWSYYRLDDQWDADYPSVALAS